MSPFYTLVNKSSYELEVGEVSSQTKWHYISSTEVNEFLVLQQTGCRDLSSLLSLPNSLCYYNSHNSIVVAQCLPLWPENGSGKLCVRVVGSESTSQSFFFNKQDNGTLLKMEMVSVH